MAEATTIAVVCENCLRKLKARASLGGKTVKCPNCKEKIDVPSLSIADGDAVVQSVVDAVGPVAARSESVVGKLKRLGNVNLSAPPAESRGDVTCPYCDATVALNVRIMGQAMSCPSCGGSVKAKKLADRRRTASGIIMFLMMLWMLGWLAKASLDMALLAAVVCFAMFPFILHRVSPDRHRTSFGRPNKGGGGWWFFFWWRDGE